MVGLWGGCFYANSLFSTTQLVVVLNNSTQGPMVCPIRMQRQKGLCSQSVVSLISWWDDVDQQDATLLEQSSEKNQGLGVQVILHSPVETSEQVVSGDGVNTSSN